MSWVSNLDQMSVRKITTKALISARFCILSLSKIQPGVLKYFGAIYAKKLQTKVCSLVDALN